MSADFSADLSHLSPKSLHVLSIDAATAYRSLVPARAGATEARDVLESLKPAEAIAGAVTDHNMAACVVSGLWLWHDYLDESHTISQSIETPTGSLWHGIMHRREGDFSNAKYWYRRCPGHPCYTSIAARVDTVVKSLDADKLLLKLTLNGWDPMTFVDLAEATHALPDDHPRKKIAVEIQKIEWQTAMQFSSRAAVGR
jgi:hypothetical protein